MEITNNAKDVMDTMESVLRAHGVNSIKKPTDGMIITKHKIGNQIFEVIFRVESPDRYRISATVPIQIKSEDVAAIALYITDRNRMLTYASYKLDIYTRTLSLEYCFELPVSDHKESWAHMWNYYCSVANFLCNDYKNLTDICTNADSPKVFYKELIANGVKSSDDNKQIATDTKGENLRFFKLTSRDATLDQL
jgi:hypothetical protein